MANEFVQTMSDARVDARSLSEFVFKPAGFKVARRLAPPIDTLQFYIDRFDATVATIPNIVNDAINNTAVVGGILADTFVTATANGIGTVARTQRDKNSDTVTPFDFGVVGDGVTDDTEALRAYHNYCNLRGIEADYGTLQSIAVQADAQILVNTDFNLRGIPIRLLNGLVDSPDWAVQNNTYIIKDEDTPLLGKSGEILAENGVGGSLTPVKDFHQEAGYFLLRAPNTLIPNRDDTNLIGYKQSFHSLGNGIVSQPLSVTIAPQTIFINYRENPKRGRLSVSNVNLIQNNSWNQQTLFSIERNQVSIDGFNVDVLAQPAGVNVSSVIYIRDCSEFSLSGLTGLGIPSSGSYLLNISGGASIDLHKIKAYDGWGWIGSNYTNGVYVSDCEVARIDGHESMHNVFVRDTTFYDVGVTIGWGGGVVMMNNITTIAASAFTTRPDYASWFDGDILINGLVIRKPREARPAFTTYKSGSKQISTLPFARNLQIHNVSVVEPVLSNTNAWLLYQQVSEGATIQAANNISIKNVRARPNVIVKVRVDYGAARSVGGRSFLSIDDITGREFTLQIESSNALVSLAETCVISALIRNIQTMMGTTITSKHPFKELTADNCPYISKLELPKVVTKGISSAVRLTNCNIINYSTAEYIGVTGTAKNRSHYMMLSDCTLQGLVDLSGATSIIGCDVYDSVALPTAVTPSTAFSGWQKTL